MALSLHSIVQFVVKLLSITVSSTSLDVRLFTLCGLILHSELNSSLFKYRIILVNLLPLYYHVVDVIPNSMLGLVFATRDQAPSDDKSSHILILWASFPLLIYGGRDDFAALSATDNDMWSIRALQFGTMAYAILSSYVQGWSFQESKLRLPAFLLFVAGCIKCIARILCNHRARLTSLKESLLQNKGRSRSSSNSLHFSEEDSPVILKSKRLERVAYSLFESFKELYVDLDVPNEVRENSRHYFLDKVKDAEEAFQVVSSELSFVYKLLFTKAMIIKTKLGKPLYFIPIICEASALVAWSCIDKHSFQKLDVIITYMLLVLLMSGEITSILSNAGVSPHYFTIQWGKDECINQLNFFWNFQDDIISLFFMYCEKFGIPYLKNVRRHARRVRLPRKQRQLLYQEFRQRASTFETSKKPCRSSGHCINILANYKPHVEELSKLSSISISDKTYDETLLLWHIATALCYYTEAEEEMQNPEVLEWREQQTMLRQIDFNECWGRKNRAGFQSEDEVQSNQGTDKYNKEYSKILSNYMMYLLLCNPNMMLEVAAMGEMRYRATLTQVKKVYPQLRYTKVEKYSGLLSDVQELSDEGNSVWFASCRLAIELKELDKNQVINLWEVIRKVWEEMLLHGAAQCSGRAHVDQLAKGGEFLTLVWLLMEHLDVGKAS